MCSRALVPVAALLALMGCVADVDTLERGSDELRLGVPGLPALPRDLACPSLDDVERDVLVARGIDTGMRLGPDRDVVDGTSSYRVRELERAAILQRAGGCAHAIWGGVLDAYREAGSIDGELVFSTPVVHVGHPLGVPLTDQVAPGGGIVETATFERDAMIVYRPGVGGHWFHGAILDEWRARGGLLGLGVPLTSTRANEAPVVGGAHVDFERGSLYVASSRPWEVRFVARPLARAWNEMNPRRLAVFTWPSFDSRAWSDGGWDQLFTGSAMLFAAPGREVAYGIWGPVLTAYQMRGGIGGDLGYPTSWLVELYDRDAAYTRFEGGILCLDERTGEVRQVEHEASCGDRFVPLRFLGDHPRDTTPEWGEQGNGLAHLGEDYWIVARKDALALVPVRADMQDAWHWDFASPPSGYDHFGDPDVAGSTLYVPIEGPTGNGLALYSTETLTLTGIARVSGGAPWCAVSPDRP